RYPRGSPSTFCAHTITAGTLAMRAFFSPGRLLVTAVILGAALLTPGCADLPTQSSLEETETVAPSTDKVRHFEHLYNAAGKDLLATPEQLVGSEQASKG